MVLFIVLGVLLVVVILSVAILEVIASHARLTHHQVSRIQAVYAGKAGLVYALEKLRVGTAGGGWNFASCTPGSPCTVPETFPSSVSSVKITFQPGGPPARADGSICVPPLGYSYCVDATVNYLFDPTNP